MRILTENLKPIHKIWNQIRVKGNPYCENILLDFDNRMMEFQNETTVVKVALQLEDNDGNGLSHPSLFLDGSKLFSLIQFYDYIDLDENNVFYSSQGDSFIIPILDEEVEFPDADCEDWETISVDFTPELNKELSLASSYVDSDASSDYSTLFIHEGTLIGCNRFKMLLGSTNNGLDTADFNIPYSLLKLIISMGMSGTVELKTRTTDNGAGMVEFSYGDLWLRYYSSSRFELPFEPESEDFLSTYDHPGYFTVSLSELSEAVKFLSSYYSDAPEAVCKFIFNTADESSPEVTLHLSYELSGTTDYKLKIKSCSDLGYFDEKTAFIFLSYVRNAIGILSQYEVEDVLITYDEFGAAMAFKDAKEEAPVFVIHTVAEELE